ncbi:expressed unknown protein [Seminavis robusta]|uniref:Uncharacterized protein n=1 Tax=Seminavis robusta TaxID=568900 RepID=A0A9N8DWF5_9STRA|nr:expressed unknown protein [Seminavis robusta]|eukprot:Sro298_g111210.1 n/a (342) ;mRNA; f:65785-66810
MRIPVPTALIWVLLLLHHCFAPAVSLSAPSYANNRHVCLLDSYQAARGPHFSALFDELFEQTGYNSKRVAFITVGSDDDENDDTSMLSLKDQMKDLEEELDLEICQLVTLSSMEIENGQRTVCDDQKALRDEIQSLNPSILWIGDHPNSNVLRYTLRIHNVDGIVHDLCGPATGRACLFVGEGAGALCSGANMAVASLRGDNSRAVPELQFRGLELLGPKRSVSFAKPQPRNIPELERLQNQLASMPLYDAEEDVTVWMNQQQVYVYSQQEGADTTSLVMNPYQKGAIEQYDSSSLPPAPPLSFSADDNNASSVARPCTGEPSEDPSRTVYTTQVEEGDYW